jgi:hypothetical protein
MIGFKKATRWVKKPPRTWMRSSPNLPAALTCDGPLNNQDGSVFLAEGETATMQQIWYLGQLLEGMEGQSVAE